MIPYTKFQHLGIIRFELCCGQTDKQTVSNVLPTPTDIVGVHGYRNTSQPATWASITLFLTYYKLRVRRITHLCHVKIVRH